MTTQQLEFVVRWGDCDPAGIIYYPTYYRWMDAGTWALLAAAGYDGDTMRAEHCTIPLVDSQCSFISSPRFGDACVVRSALTRCGRSSFKVEHEFLRLRDHALLARGYESRVWCRYSAGPGTTLRSAPLPQALRAVLRPT